MVSWRPGAGRRWDRVTVDRDPHEVIRNGLPAPLAGLRHGVEVRVRPALDGHGTELAARLRKAAGPLTVLTAYLAGDDPRLALRSALRQAKELAEARPPPPTGTERADADRADIDRASADRTDGC